MKRFLTMLLVLALALVTPVIPSQKVSAAGDEPLAAPKLNAKSKELTVGDTFKLVLKNTVDKVKFKSTNKKVVKVSSKGTVTAIAPGTAKVKVTYNGKTYKCKFTVVAKAADYPSDEELAKAFDSLRKKYPNGLLVDAYMERDWSQTDYGYEYYTGAVVFVSQMADEIFGDGGKGVYSFDGNSHPDKIIPGCLIELADGRFTFGIVTAVNGREITYVGVHTMGTGSQAGMFLKMPPVEWDQTIDVEYVNLVTTRRTPQSWGLDSYW